MWVDPVLVFALALAGGATITVAPLPGALGAFGVLLVLASRVRLAVLVGALVGLAAGALCASHALVSFDAAHARARRLLGEPQRCAVQVLVDSQPMRVGERVQWVARVESAECESGQVAPGVRVRLAGGPESLARGDRAAGIAELAPVDLWFNEGLSSPLPFAARRGAVLSGSVLALEVEARATGPLAAIDRARAYVRTRILRTYAPAAQPMARALVLGENDLDPDDAEAFRKSGLAHMLAVSGTHLVFAVVALVKALTAVLVRVPWLSAGRDVGRAAAAFGVVLACVYADFAGGSGSAWRAAFMLSAAFLARAFGRASAASRSLAASVLLGFALDPLVAFDISFVLSFTATAGLLLFSRPLARPCERLRSPVSRALGVGIATTLAAMLPCAPILALLGSDLTLAGVFANVLASPIGEAVALPLCLSHALVSAWPALESGVGVVASGALLVVRAIARESAAQTWLAIPLPDPNGYHLAVCAVTGAALSLLGRSRRFWRRVWVIAGAVALGLIEGAARQPIRRDALRVTSLSVGQGDAALLAFPDGRHLLIDAGGAPAGGRDPGASVVVPLLRAERIEHLDVMVLSHPHPDHFGGLLAVLRSVSVGELWDTGQGAAEGAGPLYAQLLAEARARGTRVRGPSELCARPHFFGAVGARVLHPCPAYVRSRGANDNSFVIRVDHGRHKFLFTGDVERDAEAELVARWGTQLRADVVKAGHHGSPTSSTQAFVDAVGARIAVLSYGARNRFGHPSPEVVTRFQSSGARVLGTSMHGSITFHSDGRVLETRTARTPAFELPGTRMGIPLTPRLRQALLGLLPTSL